MKRIRTISRFPEHATTVAPDVKIAFIVAVLQASVPLFQNKHSQNPPPPPPAGEGEPGGEGEG